MSDLQVDVAYAGRGLDVAFDVPDSGVLALLGANGSGKSTTLAVIAGLVVPDRGRVRLGGRMLVDTAAGAWVPAHRRSVALLRQEPLLFPHVSVEANVAFAPRAQGRPRRVARESARRWLDAVDAADLADRRPAQLSGGQAQRVALARALAAEPDLLLLDEPFAALDVGAAPAMRSLLRRVLARARTTAVLVTHDLLDAVALADSVAVLDAGRVVERGATRDVFAAPRSAFAAQLAGVNLVAGRLVADGVLAAADPVNDGGVELRLVGVGGDDVSPGDEAVALFRPAAVALHVEPPRGSPRNAVPGLVEDVADQGGSVRVRLRLGGAGGPLVAADITTAAFAELGPVPGSRVVAAVKAQEVSLHPMARRVR